MLSRVSSLTSNTSRELTSEIYSNNITFLSFYENHLIISINQTFHSCPLSLLTWSPGPDAWVCNKESGLQRSVSSVPIQFEVVGEKPAEIADISPTLDWF